MFDARRPQFGDCRCRLGPNAICWRYESADVRFVPNDDHGPPGAGERFDLVMHSGSLVAALFKQPVRTQPVLLAIPARRCSLAGSD